MKPVTNSEVGRRFRAAIRRSVFDVRCSMLFLLIAILFLPAHARAQMPDPPGQVGPGEEPKYEAYLFSHMMADDYGRLYYSVSLDGLH
jgi:hypothetical protein